MKKIIYLLAISSLAACTKTSLQEHGNFPEDRVIRFSTDEAHKKAGLDTDNLADFFVHIAHPTDANYSYTAQMKRDLSTTPASEWKSFDADGVTPYQMLWKNNKDIVFLTAGKMGTHTPPDLAAGQTSKDLTIPQDQSSTQGISDADLLYTQHAVDPALDLTIDGKIPLAFEHRLTQLNIELVIGTEHNHNNGTAQNPITFTAIDGTNTAFTFDFDRGGSFSNKTTPAPITPFLAQYTPGSENIAAIAHFQAILLPQTLATNTFSVTFIINGNRYQWISNTEVNLLEGQAQTLRLRAGKDLVILENISTTDWENQVGGSLETE